MACHMCSSSSRARTKQTIRFYCFLVCEKVREEWEVPRLLQVAAGCCCTVAESNKPESGQAALRCPTRLGVLCKQGRCTSCQNEQLLCKNVAQLTCSMPAASSDAPAPSYTSSLLSCSQVVCLVAKVRAPEPPEPPLHAAYGIWKLIG